MDLKFSLLSAITTKFTAKFKEALNIKTSSAKSAVKPAIDITAANISVNTANKKIEAIDIRADAYQRGFSLVEMAIVLLIMGIIATGALNANKAKIENERIKTTQKHLDLIEEALAAFVLENQRIPHPACPSTTKDSETFGVEDSAGTCSDIYVGDFGGALGNIIKIGSVPTKTLKIPDFIAFDGWRNRISYSMDTQLGGTIINFIDNPGHIRVKNKLTGSDVASDAAVLFFSHGANGLGAWSNDGNTRGADSTNGEENQNIVRSDNSRAVDATFVDRLPDGEYDDFMRYKTKAQLIREAGLEFINCPIESPWAQSPYGCNISGSNRRMCNRYGVWGVAATGSCP